MRSRNAVFLIFLLLVSSLWPLGVMAQENGVPTLYEAEGNSTTYSTGFCPLSGLETVQLTVDEALAIQGIVKQDVATSAERYERDARLAELGIEPTKTESEALVEKYNMYFMGPDGIVSYGEVLGDSLNPDNGWLIGTSIDGRVEYGGMLAEDVVMCPSLTSEESGICNAKAGSTEDDLHIRDWTVSLEFVNGTDPNANSVKAEIVEAPEELMGEFQNFGSSWITTVNWLSFRDPVDPWQSIRIDQSRLTAEKWRTTLSTNPSGGAVFVLPRTYLYFTARMKKLAVFDTAMQMVFMAEAFGAMAVPLLSKIRYLKNIGKSSIGAKISDSYLTSSFNRIDTDIGDFSVSLKNMKAGGPGVVNDLTDARKSISSINRMSDAVIESSSQVRRVDDYIEATLRSDLSSVNNPHQLDNLLGKIGVTQDQFLHSGAIDQQFYNQLIDSRAAARQQPYTFEEVITKLAKNDDKFYKNFKASQFTDVISESDKIALSKLLPTQDLLKSYPAKLQELTDLQNDLAIAKQRNAQHIFQYSTPDSAALAEVATLEKKINAFTGVDPLTKSRMNTLERSHAIERELDDIFAEANRVNPDDPGAQAAFISQKASQSKILGESQTVLDNLRKTYSGGIVKTYANVAEDYAKIHGLGTSAGDLSTLHTFKARMQWLDGYTKAGLSGDLGAILARRGKDSYMASRAGYLVNRLLITSWLRTIYTLNRRVTLIAYGLHNAGTFLELEGYLTMHSPGLTLEWDKEMASPLFTESSSIQVYGTPKSMDVIAQVGPGGFVVDDIRGLMTSFGAEPTTATKFSEMGYVLAFGGLMYNNYPELIQLAEERPQGVTRFDKHKGGYMVRIRGWDNHGVVMVEDPASMNELAKGTLISAMGMRSSNVDMYKHMFGTENQVKDAFPKTWTMSSKLTDWGLHSNLLIAGTTLFFVPTLSMAARATAGLTTVSALSRGTFGAAESFLTSQVTSMKDLETCYSSVESESGIIDCKETVPCELVEAKCEAKIGAQSAYLIVSGAVQMTADVVPGMLLPALALGITDYVILNGIHQGPVDIEGKVETTQRCMSELLSCKERSFIIIGGSHIHDPVVLAEETNQIEELKGLPGLEDLPVQDFIEGFSEQLNISADLFAPGQLQTNIHSEQDSASGRMAFRKIYYAHLKDATIDWIEDSGLPINLCPVSGGHAEADKCVTIQGNELRIGDRTLLSSALVPFKWMDEELPALVIPNTAISLPVEGDCDLFQVDPEGAITFNPSIVNKFEDENFVELERLMGVMRDLETDEGAVYFGVDYNGNQRFEMDHVDGRMIYSSEPLAVTSGAELDYANESMSFRSAVFTGGTIVKRGDHIYIIPRYFRPTITGKEWLQATRGTPFTSTTGETLEAYDELNRLFGLDASQTGIPGGDKLGVITRVDAEKDLNGNGIIEDDERSGWRFYQEGNETKFDLWYNGLQETYDSDQIEIDEDTGEIRIYEKGEEHVEANLIRIIETKVDALGRTLMTIKDGDGNTLLEDALITYLKGTGGAIRYDPDNNNYVFVNGQPVEVNNNFKTNGFNAITGRTEPPLLQPSAVSAASTAYAGEEEFEIPAVPIRPQDSTLLVYFLLIMAGLAFIRFYDRET